MKIEWTEGHGPILRLPLKDHNQLIEHCKFETKNAVCSRLLKVILRIKKGTCHVFLPSCYVMLR